VIWLLRHAEAASGGPDDERELTPEGCKQARAAGHALVQAGAHPEVCLSSPKRRAMQTAELACEALGVRVDVVPQLAGEPFDVHELIAGLDEVLLVGHDPSFSLTLHELTGAQARMKKGGLAGISKGELMVLLRPAEIAAIAAANGALT
jgi:phosphohistidine phosphatase